VAIGEAVVTAVETVSGFTKGTTSNETGAFDLDGLPAGRYVLAATKATFVSGKYGQQVPGGPRRSVDVGNGNAISVEIKMWRGGVITGHVETPRGEGVPGAAANLMRWSVDGDVKRLLPIRQNAITSDAGEYRIYGVDPGAYYVVVTPPALTLSKGLRRNVGYRPTFYPNAATADTARLVSVGAEETATADIQIQSAPLVNVQAALLDSRGSIAAPALTGIRVLAGAEGLAVQSRCTAVSGLCFFSLLPEGAYTFHSDPVKDADGRAVVFVEDAYVEAGPPAKVALRAIRATAISGIVRLPATVKRSASTSIRIRAHPHFDTKFLGPSPSVEVAPNLTFKFWAWPGKNEIVVQIQQPGLYVKALRLGGVDVTDEGVMVRDGADATGLEVELADVGQTLSGRVSQPAGVEMFEDLAVVVFPVDRGQWQSVRRTALARVDKKGEFVVRSLPPGAYVAAAVLYNDGLNYRDPKFLESIQVAAEVVSLSEGGTASLVLRR
jgi:hypothetical protein